MDNNLYTFFKLVLIGILLSIFSMNLAAGESRVTVADLNSAYNYFNNIKETSVNNRATPPAPRPAPSATRGFGGVAVNLMEPVQVASGFLSSMAIIIGMTCLFGAFIRYMQHRVNPLAHPIGIVITLLILGILLLLLPLIYKLTDSGIPFSVG